MTAAWLPGPAADALKLGDPHVFELNYPASVTG